MNVEELRQIHERSKEEYKRLLPDYHEVYKKYFPEEYEKLKNLVISGKLKPLTEQERHSKSPSVFELLYNKENYTPHIANYFDPLNLHVDDSDLCDKFNYYDWEDYGDRTYVHLNLTEKEKEFLNYFSGLIDIIHRLSFLDNDNKVYEYCSWSKSEPYDVDLLYYIDTETVHYEHEDIIITDPCYVLVENNELHNNDWNICNYGSSMENLGCFTKDKYLTSDTMYGDWSCTTYNTDTKEEIGDFCADAGLVSVFSLKQVLKYNPKFDYHIKRKWTTTLIKDFTGDVTIKVGFLSDSNELFRYVEGKGSTNFITSQTGL